MLFNLHLLSMILILSKRSSSSSFLFYSLLRWVSCLFFSYSSSLFLASLCLSSSISVMFFAFLCRFCINLSCSFNNCLSFSLSISFNSFSFASLFKLIIWFFCNCSFLNSCSWMLNLSHFYLSSKSLCLTFASFSNFLRAISSYLTFYRSAFVDSEVIYSNN